VSVLSTSSVIVLPVRVLTNICIAGTTKVFYMDCPGVNFKSTEEVINSVWLSDMPEEEKDRCIRALRMGASSASAMPECVTRYHGKSLLDADRLLLKGSFTKQDYIRMEDRRSEAMRCVTMLHDVIEKCMDVKDQIMKDTFNKFLEEHRDERFVCPFSNKLINTPIKISCGCTVDSEQFVKYLQDCESKNMLASCPLNNRTLQNFDYSHDDLIFKAMNDWIQTQKMVFLSKVRLEK